MTWWRYTIHACLAAALDIFLEPSVPLPVVAVFGHAPIAAALLRAHRIFGQQVLRLEKPDDPLPLGTRAVVVASHGNDEELVLEAALRAEVPYVALVASRRRGPVVLASLEVDERLRSRVHTPAGLDIGARTAPEVALSILAEIVAVVHEFPSHRDDTLGPASELTEVVRDPVCGMMVAPVDASHHVETPTGVVYFCGTGCRNAYLDNPSGVRAVTGGNATVAELLPDLEALRNALDGVDYLADDGTVMALFCASRLGQPVLIEGEPGVGKTEAAKALAAALQTPLVRLQCYEGIDIAEALYEWNYPRQLLAIRIAEARGIELAEDALFSDEFLIARPLLAALRHPGPRPTVLLIDEVDRADDDFEAFLLELLGEGAVTIPELGTVHATHRPIVVLTSNRTRELHDALKRRCFFHWIEYPSAARAAEIVRRRVPGSSRTARRTGSASGRTASCAGPAETARHRRNNRLGCRPGVARRLHRGHSHGGSDTRFGAEVCRRPAARPSLRIAGRMTRSRPHISASHPTAQRCSPDSAIGSAMRASPSRRTRRCGSRPS